MVLVGFLASLAVFALVARFSDLVESYAFYFPRAESMPAAPGAVDVWFESFDGARLHGWWLEAKEGQGEGGPGEGRAKGTILFCHGNADSITGHLLFVSSLPDFGYNVLLFDYRGYGRSERRGRLRRDLLIHDAEAALDWLLAQEDVDPGRVFLAGHSMGAMAGSNLAARRPVFRAVALVSGFSTWPGVAGDYVPLLGPMLVRGGRDPVSAVRGIGVPTLIMHGDADRIVRPRHAPILHASAVDAGTPAELVIVDGGDHVSVLADRQRQAFVAAFFDRVLGASDGGAHGGAMGGG